MTLASIGDNLYAVFKVRLYIYITASGHPGCKRSCDPGVAETTRCPQGSFKQGIEYILLMVISNLATLDQSMHTCLVEPGGISGFNLLFLIKFDLESTQG